MTVSDLAWGVALGLLIFGGLVVAALGIIRLSAIFVWWVVERWEDWRYG